MLTGIICFSRDTHVEEVGLLDERQSNKLLLRIGSRLACVYRVMDARGKFGEHERSVRVA